DELKSKFEKCKDELLEQIIELEHKIKELNKIIVKTGQSVQTIHMFSPKPDSFNHNEYKMALGYQNPLHLKKAQRTQCVLYDGKVLSKYHDPIYVYGSEETLKLADESPSKMKQLEQSSDTATVKKDIDEIEMINIELEHSVAKLFTENEDLNKQNEILKRHYQDLYNYIKRTRAQNIEKRTSLIAQSNCKTVEHVVLTVKLNNKTFAYAELQKIMKGKNVNT
ncbi:hypothetical protein Tco_0110319, partial [Tanacetum coccineum]